VLTSVTVVKLEYWHKDQLGSLITTTDHNGAVTARYAYDPFGKRRYSNGTYDEFGTLIVDWSPTVNAGTDRGFTGHEHLDDVGIVHMNGRIFDPTLGVFMQADPLIQDPTSLQNYNRYGYCFNNPLTCTDPSGHMSLGGILRVVAAVVIAVYAPELIGQFMIESAAGGTTLFATMSGGSFLTNAAILTPLGSFTASAAAGFVAGAVASGSFRGGLQGAFSAGVFQEVGDFLNAQGAFAGGKEYGEWSAMGVTSHAVAGCVTGVQAGAKCGPSALSAAFSQAALPLKENQNPIVGAITSAVIGGTASELGGGNFANGARTATFGYLFNCWNHVGVCSIRDSLMAPDNPLHVLFSGIFGGDKGMPDSPTYTAGGSVTGAVVVGSTFSAGVYYNPGNGISERDYGFYWAGGTGWGFDDSLGWNVGYVFGNSSNLRGYSTNVSAGLSFGDLFGLGYANTYEPNGGPLMGQTFFAGTKGLIGPPGATSTIMNTTGCTFSLKVGEREC
jgi:RHS repeat-associated protein